MIQTEEIRLIHMVRSWARPLAVAILVATAAACGGGNDGAAAGQGKDARAANRPGQQTGDTTKAQSQAAPVRTAYGKTAAQSQQCFQRLQARLDSAANAQKADSTAK